jgi:hypothetical protein
MLTTSLPDWVKWSGQFCSIVDRIMLYHTLRLFVVFQNPWWQAPGRCLHIVRSLSSDALNVGLYIIPISQLRKLLVGTTSLNNLLMPQSDISRSGSECGTPQSCFIFGRFQVQFSTQRTAVLTVQPGFFQILRSNFVMTHVIGHGRFQPSGLETAYSDSGFLQLFEANAVWLP